jgi:hypothetical protein
MGGTDEKPPVPTTPSTSSTTSTRALSRKTRVYAFRDFLIQTYGPYLDNNDDGHVLDVAGGKGDLSWLLQNVDAISSVVLDPRGDVSKCAIPKSVRYLKEHPEEAERRAVPGLPTHQPLAVLMPQLADKESVFVLPRHLPISLDQQLVDKVKNVVDKKEDAHDEWDTFWNDKIVGHRCHGSGRGCTKGNLPSTTDTAISTADEALQVILGTKLVAGFHPDQATDYCIEMAQILRVPFCIVPCCVFPSEFPHRQVSTTHERVQNYTQLIQYLREKCPEAKTGFLNFHFAETAKNLVLYTEPAGYHSDNKASHHNDCSNRPLKRQK